ncbi:MAG TPA: hypothetical protein DCS30_08800 [Rhizobiales bacterium]|nr:hypothetical protein [Hyphomicrobiales bacterium]
MLDQEAERLSHFDHARINNAITARNRHSFLAPFFSLAMTKERWIGYLAPMSSLSDIQQEEDRKRRRK